MKLNAVAGICKKIKAVTLMNDEDRQWVGDGYSMYLLPESLPYLSKESICTMLDIPVKQAASFMITEKDFPEAICTEDSDDTERDLTWDADCRVLYLKKDLLPLKTEEGKVYFIPTKALKPLEDCKVLRLQLRLTTSDERPYIVAKDGLFLVGVIMPQRTELMLPWLRSTSDGAVSLTREEESDDA